MKPRWFNARMAVIGLSAAALFSPALAQQGKAQLYTLSFPAGCWWLPWPGLAHYPRARQHLDRLCRLGPRATHRPAGREAE